MVQYLFLHPIVVLLYIKEQRFRHTQYIYIINNVNKDSVTHNKFLMNNANNVNIVNNTNILYVTESLFLYLF
jgi:hypothetical protein